MTAIITRAVTIPAPLAEEAGTAAACEALRYSTTTNRARRRLEGIRGPALRAAALAVLEQLGDATPAEETSS